MNPTKQSNDFSSSLLPSSSVFICGENPGPSKQQEHRFDNKFTDIHFKAGDKTVPAHRLALSSSCSFLEKMLSDNWDPQQKGVCELSEDIVHPSIVDDLLNFLYTRKVTITNENAKLLAIAANYLVLPTLQSATERFLGERLSSTNCAESLIFAIKYQLEFLRKSCAKFIRENPDTVFKDARMLDFPAEDLLQLFTDMKEPRSNMATNEAMFELAINWTKKDLTTRMGSFVTLLNTIPLVELSEDFLKKTVSKEDNFSYTSAARKLITEALNEVFAASKLPFPSNTETTETSSSYNLYFFGGLRKHDEKNDPTDSVSHLNVSAREWKNMSPMMTRGSFYDFSIASIGHKVYRFGGMPGQANTAEMFDTKRNEWTLLRPIPVSPNNFKGHAAVEHKGVIYVSGGYENEIDGHITELSPIVHRYCASTNQWTSVSSMLTPRGRHKLISFKNHIYAIGGDNGHRRYTIEKYNPEVDRWEMCLQDIPDIIGGLIDATVYQGKIYIFQKNDLAIYNPETNALEIPRINYDAEEANVNPYYPTVVTIDDKIWAVDNFQTDRDGYLREFNPATGKWKRLDLIMNSRLCYYRAVVIKQ